MKPLRITNETGMTRDTKVTDIRTGVEITGVQSITLTMLPDEVVLATIKLIFVQCDEACAGRFQAVDPYTGELRDVSKIVWADGETCSLDK